VVVVAGSRADACLPHLPAIPADLCAADLEQRHRAHAVAGQEAMHTGGWSVSWLTRVDDHHRAPRPGKRQGATQAGGATADHYDVVCICHCVDHVDHLTHHHPSFGSD